MNSRVALLLAAMAAMTAQPLRAQDAFPVIREISFTGNESTQPKVMLREMFIKPEDPADPEKIERSRQGIQDLGLFRWVRVEQQPVVDGVRLVFSVKEKYYLLPLPSASVNSDRGYSYGFRVRWYNAWGLNHNFVSYYQRRQPAQGTADPVKLGVQTRYEFRYVAPFVADSPYSVNMEAGHLLTPYLAPLVYDDRADFGSIGLSRRLSTQPGTQGWEVRADLNWTRERATGPGAPVDQGRATFPTAGVDFRDLRYNLYSDEGVAYGVSVGSASRAVLSDYAFTSWSAHYARYVHIGETPHQSLDFIANTASRHGGPPGSGPAYGLGGVDNLRGFEPDTVKGESFYLVTAEYLRPVFRDSIRALVVIDAGSMVDAGNGTGLPGDVNIGKVLVSAGVGVRIRFQAFVNLDLEVGVAWPLNGGPQRIFASKV